MIAKAYIIFLVAIPVLIFIEFQYLNWLYTKLSPVHLKLIRIIEIEKLYSLRENSTIYLLLIRFPVGAFFEELVFRFAPGCALIALCTYLENYFGATSFFAKTTLDFLSFIIIAGLSQAVFGILHGERILILIQGVGGVVMLLFFMAAYEVFQHNLGIALAYSTLYHYLWNTSYFFKSQNLIK